MGMMFWYGIEQLFLDDVLLDSDARAWVTTVFAATLLVFDIPGGWVADRFGRKKTLLVALSVQGIGVGLLAVSSSLPLYLAGTFVFGLYWALSSGTMQAYLYDHLKQTDMHHLYAKHQGGVYASSYIGAGIANILSGVIADHSTLRIPYLVSLVPVIIGIGLAAGLHNAPTPPKAAASSIGKRAWFRNIPTIFHILRTRPAALFYGFQIALAAVIFLTICEFGQIFLLSYDITATELGILWAIDAVVVAAALRAAYRFRTIPRATVTLYVLILLGFSCITSPIAIILFMLVYAWSEIVHTVAETEIQHVTSSHIRATVLSAVTFMGNVLSLPFIWWFNQILHRHNVHAANRSIALAVASAALVSVILIFLYERYAAIAKRAASS